VQSFTSTVACQGCRLRQPASGRSATSPVREMQSSDSTCAVVRVGNIRDLAPTSVTAEPRRCAGTTNAGAPCRSRAINGSDFCIFHDEDHREIARRGGEVSAARRSVRERFREDAEHHYQALFDSLIAATQAEVTRWGDCPECHHRVGARGVPVPRGVGVAAPLSGRTCLWGAGGGVDAIPP
jgi:hypothetical protein